MGKQEFYKIPEKNRTEIWNKLTKIQAAVASSKGLVQNDMMVTQEEQLDTFYYAINDIMDDLLDVKHEVNDTKELYYTEVYDEDGEVVKAFYAGEE